MQEKYLFLKDIITSIIIALFLTIIIRVFIFEPFYIPTSSMEPTLYPGDRIIASKIYKFENIEIGDIIVFKFPLDYSKNYVKRVVALGNDIVEIKDNKLYVNHKEINEDYLPPNIKIASFGPEKVPEECVFVMGDNRNDSYDSRFWGPLSKDAIIGKVFLKFWPFHEAKLYKN